MFPRSSQPQSLDRACGMWSARLRRCSSSARGTHSRDSQDVDPTADTSLLSDHSPVWASAPLSVKWGVDKETSKGHSSPTFYVLHMLWGGEGIINEMYNSKGLLGPGLGVMTNALLGDPRLARVWLGELKSTPGLPLLPVHIASKHHWWLLLL